MKKQTSTARHYRRQQKAAFTLVEIAIVLVILGLIAGGVLISQNLIRSAQLRAVTTEYSRWVTATRTFKSKYQGLPGDITDATSYWGKDNAACTSDTGTTTTPGACNGDGDGILMFGSASPGTKGERNQFWKQLALAGLIEGNYTGLNDPTYGRFADTQGNAPLSKLTPGVWGTYYGTADNNSYEIAYAANYGNALRIGSPYAATYSHQPVMKGLEAWEIDKKIDDGMPGQGFMMVYYPNMGTACTSATSATDFAATYNRKSSTIACFLLFRGALD